MSRPSRVRTGLALLASSLLVGVSWRWSGGSSPAPPRAAAPVPRIPLVPLAGSASCSGRSCHGSLDAGEPDTVSRRSYAVWARQDPHADSYAVLGGAAARAMADRLGLGDPAKESRCLACHTNPLAAAANASESLIDERAFGVGCEACHGPAGTWLQPHKSVKWGEMSREKKEAEYKATGMTWLQDLGVRAQVCAGCHVGAAADPAKGLPERDVNHDLIAAGHPPLLFEFGAYHARMPRHWREKEREATFEARAWAVGRAVAAREALLLLADRCDRAEQGKAIWPEFAEQDCFACHHDLGGARWRQRPGPAGHPPGSPRGRPWYVALLPFVLDPKGVAKAPPMPDLAGLEKALFGARPAPGPIAQQAREAAGALEAWVTILERRRYTPKQVQELRAALAREGPAAAASGWDAAAQVLQGLAALQQACDDSRTHPGPAAAGAIRELSKKLAFPFGYKSPKDFRRDADFDAALNALFRQVEN